MDQIKIYHEAPIEIFIQVQERTDGDYALVHVLDRNPAYAATFIDAAHHRGDRTLILDNSAYELGKAFDVDLFEAWIRILKPDIYVVPDVPGDAKATVEYLRNWDLTYDFPGDRMAVLQGTSFDEILWCCEEFEKSNVDIIGVPFLIGRRLKYPDARMNGTNLSLMHARVQLVNALQDSGCDTPLHLLGVALPQEGVFYQNSPWVKSVDTSNPILHGMQGTEYGVGGVPFKPAELMADLMDEALSQVQRERIWANIGHFKRMWSR